MQRLKTGLVCLTSVAISIVSVGCGSGKVPTAPVKGKVTYNGQPVTGGSITFGPIGSKSQKDPGQPGFGEVGPDGSYSLKSQGADGAPIGKNKVIYAPPASETLAAGPDGHAETKASPFAGLVPKQDTVEVNAGENSIDIELVPGPGAAVDGAVPPGHEGS
jgi:hypothetical protein